METALVLINLEPSQERETLKKLKQISGVNEAHFLYGIYDAYLRIDGETGENIQKLVLDKIRNIEGIKLTMTCFIVD